MFSPAKINLYLHITGKRPDGYHLLDSLMVFTDLSDVINIKESAKTTLEITGEFAEKISSGADNIILKAYNLLKKQTKIKKSDIAIQLEKNIPVGAGMGGGSGNAAGILSLLNNFWEMNLSIIQLQKLGLKLGADVPFCLGKKAAFVSGIGENLDYIDFVGNIHAVLVNPGKGLSTKDVFNSGNIEHSGVVKKPAKFTSKENLIDFLIDKKNDLEKSAIKLMPEIADILVLIRQQQGCLISRMSGSGATCFGLFYDAQSALNAEEKIRENNSDWWVRKTELRFSL